MKFSRKEKNFYFLIISFGCLLVVLTLYKNFNVTSSNGPRNLLSQDQFNARCKKASKDYIEKVKSSPDGLILGNVTMDKYLEVLKEIIENNEYEKINKYLPRILIYLIIAIIDVIFIILWIIFCCYACKKVEKQNRIGCGAKCCFFLYFIVCIVVIIFSIIGIIYTPYLTKSFNSLACSINKLVFHFLNGINDENEAFHWMGLNNIKKNITDDYPNALESVDRMISSLNNINNTTLDDLEKMIEPMDNLYPYSAIISYGGVAAFNLLGLLAMFFVFVCEFKCMSCLFHLFWNIEIILIIDTFFSSAIIGSLSVVSKDISKILIDQVDIKNLNNESNNFIFNFTELREEINISINGDGNLYSHIFRDKEEEMFKKELEKMHNKTEYLNGYNCSFFKMDYIIMVDVLNNTISKKLYFLSLLFIILDVAGIISIFLGITVYNSQKDYSPPDSKDVNVNNRMQNNRIDLSTENLRKQNNEIIFSKK